MSNNSNRNWNNQNKNFNSGNKKPWFGKKNWYNKNKKKSNDLENVQGPGAENSANGNFNNNYGQRKSYNNFNKNKNLNSKQLFNNFSHSTQLSDYDDESETTGIIFDSTGIKDLN